MIKKAWQVTEEFEGIGKIVFAETRGKAKAEGASQLDRDFMEVTIHRAKQYDQYAEQGKVPIEVMLDNCWWFTCAGCDKQVDQEDINNGSKIVGDNVYCVECAKELIPNEHSRD